MYFLCFLRSAAQWSFKRIFIKSSAGRQRFNVVGAVDAITKKSLLSPIHKL